MNFQEITQLQNRSIKLEFNDLEVLHVNDKDFTVTLKMYLGVHWNEPRIVSLNSQKHSVTPLDLNFLEHVWLPDLEILHLKELKGYKVLKELAGKQQSNSNSSVFLFGDYSTLNIIFSIISHRFVDLQRNNSFLYSNNSRHHVLLNAL